MMFVRRGGEGKVEFSRSETPDFGFYLLVIYALIGMAAQFLGLWRAFLAQGYTCVMRRAKRAGAHEIEMDVGA